TSIEYKAHFPTQDVNNSSSLQQLSSDEIHEFLWDYFQLNINLKGYYNKWSSVDGHFAKIANQFQGIRILRQDPLDYKEAHKALLQLTGCLMSLDKHNAIPVDTHVWQIAKREYGFNSGNKGSKTLTSRAYEAVGNHFRKLFGDYTDLKAFENRQQQNKISKNGLITQTNS
ncbi:10848_t:CDS:2, partial [Diversispora eburnea]